MRDRALRRGDKPALWRPGPALAGREFISGDTYTIADIAAYPWIVPRKRQQQDLDSFPNLRRWFNAVRERPATQRAYARGEPYANRPTVTERGKKILFGQTAQVIQPSVQGGRH